MSEAAVREKRWGFRAERTGNRNDKDKVNDDE
jgi:hypothetical protein